MNPQNAANAHYNLAFWLLSEEEENKTLLSEAAKHLTTAYVLIENHSKPDIITLFSLTAEGMAKENSYVQKIQQRLNVLQKQQDMIVEALIDIKKARDEKWKRVVE